MKSDYGKRPVESGFGEGIKGSRGRWYVCEKCNKLYNANEGCCVKEEKVETFYVPDQKETFNIGLGRMCPNNARAVEKIAKKMGLQPLGDAPLPKPKPVDTREEFKIIEKGYREARTLGRL